MTIPEGFELEEESEEIPQGFAKEKEKLTPYLGRQIARSGARVLETLGGGIGDIIQALQGLAAKSVQKVTGREIPQKIDIAEHILGIPTTRKIKQIEKLGVGEYLEPKTRKEQFSDDIIQSATSLAALKVPMTRAIKGAALGTSLKYLGESMNLPTWAQIGLDTLGTTLGSASFGNINEYKNALYKSTEELLPKEAVTNAKNLENSLLQRRKQLSYGLTKAPQKQRVIETIDEILQKIENGNINVKDLWESKKDIYKLLGENYKEVKGYKNVLKNVNNDVKNTLYGYGKQNPEFVQNLVKSDKFFGNLSEFERNTSFINDIKGAEKFGAALAFLNGNIKQATKMLGIGKAIEMGYNIFKNPRVINFYSNALKESAKLNKAGVINNLRKLNEELINQSKEIKEQEIKIPEGFELE